jgi:hypothetical protein
MYEINKLERNSSRNKHLGAIAPYEPERKRKLYAYIILYKYMNDKVAEWRGLMGNQRFC